jgi:hypothetical protein
VDNVTETSSEPRELITAIEVVERLADVLDGEAGTPQRIEITRQSDVLYVCRVYPVGEDDYLGFSFEL